MEQTAFQSLFDNLEDNIKTGKYLMLISLNGAFLLAPFF